MTHSLNALLLDSDDPRPLAEQIFVALSQRIVSRLVAPGTRLPATRNLAKELGVSRSTVVQSYEQLAAEGYVKSRQGSGYFACDVGDADALYALYPRRKSEPDRNSAAEPVAKASFPGVPDMTLFPHAAWAKHVARTARQTAEAMRGSTERFGHRRLREAVASHLSAWRGIDASADQIVITAGAGDALELCLRSLTGERRVIAMENPTYPPLFNMAKAMNLDIRWMAVDEAGAIPPKSTARPVATVLTPSYQFPLGGVMPRSERLAFLEQAERDGGWIIEDDFDSEFRYAGRPVPALASLDGSQRVIYVGSFSKIFSSGLRIGFIVAPVSLIPRFKEMLSRFGQRASIMSQLPIASFIEDGSFHRHIRRMRRTYGERRQVFVDAFRAGLPPSVTFTDHRAGMQIALRFPDDWRDGDIANRAQATGLTCLPLSTFCYEAPVRSGLLVGFSTIVPDEAHEPLAKLIEILRDYGSQHVAPS